MKSGDEVVYWPEKTAVATKEWKEGMKGKICASILPEFSKTVVVMFDSLNGKYNIVATNLRPISEMRYLHTKDGDRYCPKDLPLTAGSRHTGITISERTMRPGDEAIYWPTNIAPLWPWHVGDKCTIVFSGLSPTVKFEGESQQHEVQRGSLRPLSEMTEIEGKYMPITEVYGPPCWIPYSNNIIKSKGTIMSSAEQMNYAMYSCPRSRELTPEESIKAKKSRIQKEVDLHEKAIANLTDQMVDLDRILDSISWRDETPDSVKDKLVEAADKVGS